MRHMFRSGPTAGGLRELLRLALPSILVFSCLAIAPAALARPSAWSWRAISDPVATPSFTITNNGFGASWDSSSGVVAPSASTAYVAGSAGNADGNDDVTLAKITNGAQSWLKRYDGPAHKADGAFDVAMGPGGVVYTVGYSKNAIDREDFLVVKWSASGKVLWARRYDGPLHGDDRAPYLGVDRYGNVTVAGWSQGTGGLDWAVVNWSAGGVRRWAWRYGGSAHLDDRPADVVVTPAGDVYVTGSASVTGPKTAALTVKFSATGKKVWSKLYLGTANLGANTIGMTPRAGGGVITCGITEAAATAADGLVMSYTVTGKRLVFTPDVGTGHQSFYDVAVASNGTIAAVGRDLASGDSQARTRLYKNDGTALTSGSSVGGAWDDAFLAVATDRFGGVYPIGYYGAAAGKQLWIGRAPVVTGGGSWASKWGTPDGSNYAGGIAVAGTTVYVVGMYYGGPAELGNQVVLVYKY